MDSDESDQEYEKIDVRKGGRAVIGSTLWSPTKRPPAPLPQGMCVYVCVRGEGRGE